MDGFLPTPQQNCPDYCIIVIALSVIIGTIYSGSSGRIPLVWSAYILCFFGCFLAGLRILFLSRLGTAISKQIDERAKRFIYRYINGNKEVKERYSYLCLILLISLIFVIYWIFTLAGIDIHPDKIFDNEWISETFLILLGLILIYVPTWQLIGLARISEHKKVSLSLIVLSTYLTIWLLWILVTVIRVEQRYIPFSFSTSRDLQIENVSIMIRKEDDALLRRPSDETEIRINYRNNNPGEQSIFSIYVPSFLKLTRSNEGVSIFSQRSTEYSLRIDAEEDRQISLRFTGDVISTTSSDLDLRIQVSTYYDNSLPEDFPLFPVNIGILGIDSSDINYVIPKQYISEESVEFDYSKRQYIPDASLEFDYSKSQWQESGEIIYGKGEIYELPRIRLRLENTNIGYNKELLVILVGSIIGFLSSITASVIWDLLKPYLP
ncbi:MAG: hypothetical protein F6K19_46085 [Cyanothece sp. SIO1E1]|nr:hypothetical protein [Cyanothece sp. SIO1E1]